MGSKSADLSSEARAREEDSAKEEPFLQPWQFFLLGGMLAATATVIVATHDRELIRRVGRRAVTLEHGRIVEVA